MYQETLSDIQQEANAFSQELIAAAEVEGEDQPAMGPARFYGLALAPVAVTLLVAAVTLIEGTGGPNIQPWCPVRGCTI